MGLRRARGASLQRIIATIGAVAFLLQGYNQSMMNGLLTLPAFNKLIPESDTINTEGAVKAHHAKIQGRLLPFAVICHCEHPNQPTSSD